MDSKEHPSNSSESSSVVDKSFLRDYASTSRFRNGRPTSFSFVADDEEVPKILFLRASGLTFEQDLFEYDVSTQTERTIVSASSNGKQETLSQEEKARRERIRLSARGVVRYCVNTDIPELLVPMGSALCLVHRQSGKITEVVSTGEFSESFPMNAEFSPDGLWISCIRDGNLLITDRASHVEVQLSPSKSRDTLTYGLPEFVAQEEMDRGNGYWWSPDSRMVLFQATDTENLEQMHIMDPTHPEQPPNVFRYPRPGKANAEIRLYIADVGDKHASCREVKWDHEQYPYLAVARWHSSGILTITVQSREQMEMVLLSVNPATCETTALSSLESKYWVNIDQSLPVFLNEDLYIWERNGCDVRALSVYSVASKDVVADISCSQGADFRKLSSVAQTDDQTWMLFMLCGFDQSEQSLEIASFDMKNSESAVVACTAREDFIVSAECWGSYVLLQKASMDGPHTFEICLWQQKFQPTGTITSHAASPSFSITTKIADVGPLRFKSALTVPNSFDSSATYPVIVYVYGGPHHRTVVHDQTVFFFNQWLANHGFVVVQFDVRGTPFRGEEWETVWKSKSPNGKGNFIRCVLDDQVAALQAFSKDKSFMDVSRVGIFGWSFGGYFSAMAAMLRPDVFHAAFSGAPVSNWSDYDTHYTERYIGTPESNPDGYQDSSCEEQAQFLVRPLFVVHGTADDNVYFSHSIKMSNALFRHGKEHSFLPLVDFTHMVTDPTIVFALYGRMALFFMQNVRDGTRFIQSLT